VTRKGALSSSSSEDTPPSPLDWSPRDREGVSSERRILLKYCNTHTVVTARVHWYQTYDVWLVMGKDFFSRYGKTFTVPWDFFITSLVKFVFLFVFQRSSGMVCVCVCVSWILLWLGRRRTHNFWKFDWGCIFKRISPWWNSEQWIYNFPKVYFQLL